MTQQFEEILALISERQYDRAKSMIDAAHHNIGTGQRHRLTALAGVIEMKKGNFSGGIDLMRQAIREEPTWLPHWYRLGVYLMDAERWSEAIAAIDEIVSLSDRSTDFYFIDEARFRKLICLKALGRDSEIKPLKNNIQADTEVFIGDRLYTLNDF